MASYIALGFRNRGKAESTLGSAGLAARATCLVLMAAAGLFAQDPSAAKIKSLERSLRDYGGLIRYGSDNSELPAVAKGEDRVIFFGDQITEFWGRKSGQFFPGKTWLNRGIAGQTTDQMLIRFRQDVIALNPKVVVILAGLNDIAGLHGSSTEEMILDNLTSMTELARANGIRVVLASLTPVCNCFGQSAVRERWQERIAETNELIEKYCAKSGARFLDYFEAMSEDGRLKKTLTDDGVIPNEAGYKVMAKLAEKSIAEALKK
jgi:lysophospholipase L1-like esterase